MTDIDAHTRSQSALNRQARIDQCSAIAEHSMRAAELVSRLDYAVLSTEQIKACYALICALTDAHINSTYYRFASLLVDYIKTNKHRYITVADVCAVFSLSVTTSCAATTLLRALVALKLADKDATKVYKLYLDN